MQPVGNAHHGAKHTTALRFALSASNQRLFASSLNFYHQLNSSPKATARFDQIRWPSLVSSIARAIASIREEDLVLWGY
ncbi:hypothetical protein ACTXT7_015536 [Hymenolepis weldensis]